MQTVEAQNEEPRIVSPEQTENAQNHSAELKQVVNFIYEADSILSEGPPSMAEVNQQS